MEKKQQSVVVEPDPKEGGSYIRNKDGSLTKQAPADEQAPAKSADDIIDTKD